jgi:hypothetical protein
VTKTRHVWIWTALGLAIACGFKLVPFQFSYRWLAELVVIFVIGVLMRIGASAVRLPRIAAITQIAAPLAVLVGCWVNAYLIALLLTLWVWSLMSKSGLGIWFFNLKPLQIAGLSWSSLYTLHWVVFGYVYIAMYCLPVLRESVLQISILGMLLLAGAASWVCRGIFESSARKLLNRGFDVVRPSRARAGSPPDIETALLEPGAEREFGTDHDLQGHAQATVVPQTVEAAEAALAEHALNRNER